MFWVPVICETTGLLFSDQAAHVERMLALSLSVKLQMTATAARTEDNSEAVTSPDLSSLLMLLR